jgi:hypothetical protein
MVINKNSYDFQQERLDIEEKYSNLQEEKAGKTKKIDKKGTCILQKKSLSFVLNFSKVTIYLIQKYIKR